VLLDCPNGAFDLADVHIAGCEIECGGQEVMLYAFKLHVTVNVDDVETTCMVHLEHMLDFILDGFFS